MESLFWGASTRSLGPTANVVAASSRYSLIGTAARPSCAHSVSDAGRIFYGMSMVERSRNSALLYTRFTSSLRNRTRIRFAAWSRYGLILQLDACRSGNRPNRPDSDLCIGRRKRTRTKAYRHSRIVRSARAERTLAGRSRSWIWRRRVNSHLRISSANSLLIRSRPNRSTNVIPTRVARRSSSATAGRKQLGWREISRVKWSAILFVRRSSLRSRNLPTLAKIPSQTKHSMLRSCWCAHAIICISLMGRTRRPYSRTATDSKGTMTSISTWPFKTGGRPRRQYAFVRRCCVRSAIPTIR